MNTDKPADVEKFTVAVPFKAPFRKFAVGAEVTRADLEGTPLDFDHIKAKFGPRVLAERHFEQPRSRPRGTPISD